MKAMTTAMISYQFSVKRKDYNKQFQNLCDGRRDKQQLHVPPSSLLLNSHESHKPQTKLLFKFS